MLVPDPWSHLRPTTPARIALGRAGGSLPTAQWLDFAKDHALARNAVHAPFDTAQLSAELTPLLEPHTVTPSPAPASQVAFAGDSLANHSLVGGPAPGQCAGRAEVGPRGGSAIRHLATRATSRRDYLLRPDWGRQLDEPSAQQLDNSPPGYDLVIIVSDGLSAFAANRQVAPLLAYLLPLLRDAGWNLAPLLIVPFARVALQDEIGERLRARAALILLGERPGLLAPDSLGAYLVWGPRRGRTDADRNCVSNIRPEGLPHASAARTLARLLNEARRVEFSGVRLKDEGDPALLVTPSPVLTTTPTFPSTEPGQSPPTHP
ncbi:MAG: ethanolamine ammonia-lyase subunit EutC [Planctomycetaceae bacterium]